MTEVKKYSEIYDYLSAPLAPTSEEGNIVFGRADQLLAKKMAEQHKAGNAKYFIVTGGVGKDSGELAKQGIPEARYVGREAVKRGVPSEKLHLDVHATNGGENARNSLHIVEAGKLAVGGLTVVAHATSLVRLSETLVFEAEKKGQDIGSVHRIGTDYNFDPSNPVDQQESVAELLRLADWPAKGFLGEQPDLPQDLVEFARSQKQ